MLNTLYSIWSTSRGTWRRHINHVCVTSAEPTAEMAPAAGHEDKDHHFDHRKIMHALPNHKGHARSDLAGVLLLYREL